MKLIIQIPCFNEEQTLPVTIRDLPRQIPGIDSIEYLVIDDGSMDRTIEAAKTSGVHHIVRLTVNRGLATAFSTGIDECLKRGADIIVNTDGDNQYRGEDIARLVRPILDRKADIVIGARNIGKIDEFSAIKKIFQKIGSSVLRRITHTTIPDMTSGFRAYSREAALRMNVTSDFTYTLETIIQASVAGIAITHIPIQTNKKLRESRLFSSMSDYIGKSIVTIIRIYTMYEPLKVFVNLGSLFFILGMMGILRFLFFYITLINIPTGHIQSLIISAISCIIGFGIIIFGMLADVTSKNRILMEDVLVRIKKMEYAQKDDGARGG